MTQVLKKQSETDSTVVETRYNAGIGYFSSERKSGLQKWVHVWQSVAEQIMAMRRTKKSTEVAGRLRSIVTSETSPTVHGDIAPLPK